MLASPWSGEIHRRVFFDRPAGYRRSSLHKSCVLKMPVGRTLPWLRDLKMEPIAEFYIDFAWSVPVESAEGDAVVEFDPAVGHIHRIQRGGKIFGEVFA